MASNYFESTSYNSPLSWADGSVSFSFATANTWTEQQTFSKPIETANGGTAPTSVTVGASPFSYTNSDGYTEVVVVTGGAGITETLNGVAIVSSAITGTVHSYILRNGDVLAITYTTAPTVVKYSL